MNSLRKRISEILGGRVDFDVIEIDSDLLLSDVSDNQDTFDKNNDTVSGQCKTADDIRAWLETLPESSFSQHQDYLWHDHK